MSFPIDSPEFSKIENLDQAKAFILWINKKWADSLIQLFAGKYKQGNTKLQSRYNWLDSEWQEYLIQVLMDYNKNVLTTALQWAKKKWLKVL